MDQINLIYQHSIREGYLMYRKFKDESKIYFSQEGLGSMGDVWEQTRSRGDFRRHIGLHNYIIKKVNELGITNRKLLNLNYYHNISFHCLLEHYVMIYLLALV